MLCWSIQCPIVHIINNSQTTCTHIQFQSPSLVWYPGKQRMKNWTTLNIWIQTIRENKYYIQSNRVYLSCFYNCAKGMHLSWQMSLLLSGNVRNSMRKSLLFRICSDVIPCKVPKYLNVSAIVKSGNNPVSCKYKSCKCRETKKADRKVSHWAHGKGYTNLF